MKPFRTQVWSYAVLLIILFAIASLAVWQTISYLERNIAHDEFRIAAATVWVLTLGFMSIAGAFGLWAIKFSTETESRRRIGRLVDSMYYLSDGLIAVDKKARITGSNPSARSMAKAELAGHETLKEAFQCLSAEDVALLLSKTGPNEVERESELTGGRQVLRFRAQQSEGLTLVLISDVTTMNAQRQRQRQIARLQLIGQIARGVAHDFNKLLCEISGHASLLTRVPPGSPEMTRSVGTITREIERGISLAGHLLELARPDIAGRSTDATAEHVEIAAGVLRDSLPEEWNVKTTIQQDIPTVGLTGMQVEQLVLNLGLLAAGATSRPGTLHVVAGTPGSTHLFDVSAVFAGVILISAAKPDVIIAGNSQKDVRDTSDESGVILSVIRSMIEEAGGIVDVLLGADKSPIYRICLPRGNVPSDAEDVDDLPGDLAAYVAPWSVLLAAPAREHGVWQTRLRKIGVKVEFIENITSALARIENGRNLDAMVIDRYLLGQEAGGLLKAILKLCPSAGIVVLCDDPQSESEGLSSKIVFLQARAGQRKFLTALIEAKGLASRRQSTRPSNPDISRFA